MKEKLIVKNFSVIDDVEIDIKKINILIGPQSTGKSLIAKLVYIFKSIHTNMSKNIIDEEGKRELYRTFRFEFNSIFPEYLVNEKSFEVVYYYGDNFISITNKGAKSFKSYKISFSDSILKRFEKLKKKYKKLAQNQNFSDTSSKLKAHVAISHDLEQFLYGTSAWLTTFVPAGRSYFADIERNIFTLQSEFARIDRMLLIFGSILEALNKNLISFYSKEKTDFKKELYRLTIDVVGGEYSYKKTSSYLTTKNDKRIYLKDSSSGQQEAAPLIGLLLALTESDLNRFYFCIEEPEAHLFPDSQRKIVEIIAMVYNLLKRESGFFITTHSPYILTSFNNLIQAENTYGDILDRFEKGKIDDGKKEEQLKKLDKIISPKKRVTINDVSVYSIQNGKCKNIKDKENNLIDANEIDEVSDSLAGIYDQMLDISYGE
jgi:predicted ATPase